MRRSHWVCVMINLNLFRIVLISPSHAGNVGSTARAMKTMGFSSLYLVKPRCSIDGTAHALAAGADDVLASTIVSANLTEALTGCQFIIGMSARPRDMEVSLATPSVGAQLALQAVARGERVALVFGREDSGLTNEELLQCHYHVTIPTCETFQSLNLAQAVQVMVYEVRKTALEGLPSLERKEAIQRATAENVAGFYAHLEAVLIKIDFLKLSNPKRLMQRLRRLFNRAELEPVEVNILRGILTQVEHHIH